MKICRAAFKYSRLGFDGIGCKARTSVSKPPCGRLHRGLHSNRLNCIAVHHFPCLSRSLSVGVAERVGKMCRCLMNVRHAAPASAAHRMHVSHYAYTEYVEPRAQTCSFLGAFLHSGPQAQLSVGVRTRLALLWISGRRPPRSERGHRASEAWELVARIRVSAVECRMRCVQRGVLQRSYWCSVSVTELCVAASAGSPPRGRRRWQRASSKHACLWGLPRSVSAEPKSRL